jgi:starvation-inducible DNA-binding protein
MQTNYSIGITAEQCQKISQSLNQLLANYSVFYQNLRGFHWNIQGNNFFELHLKFEELYDNILLKIDEIAERILTLGNSPIHLYSAYLQTSKIQEISQTQDGLVGVGHILGSMEILIGLQREILKTAQEAGDEGTASMMSDYIREQEKLMWMYRAYMK